MIDTVDTSVFDKILADIRFNFEDPLTLRALALEILSDLDMALGAQADANENVVFYHRGQIEEGFKLDPNFSLSEYMKRNSYFQSCFSENEYIRKDRAIVDSAHTILQSLSSF